MCHITCTAVMVATLAFGTVAASATDYGEKLASWLQLTQATETPREETGVPVPPEAIATVLDEQDVMSVLGVRVRSNVGEDMGRIINVVVDGTGQVRAAVIDFGGFLGVGARKIAVDWNALHFAPAGSKDDRITLDLTRDQVKAAPEYKDGRPLVMLGTAESLQPSPSSE
jgi:PRC-barrel domain